MTFSSITRLCPLFGAILALAVWSSCTKQTCPDYWQYPDCNTQSRVRFYGIYKGISTMTGQQPATTQWQAGDAFGLEISEICISSDMTLSLDPKDIRVFKVKEGSRMANGFIRHDGYGGRFTDDSLYFDFWLYDNQVPEPGETGTHYTFAGRKK